MCLVAANALSIWDSGAGGTIAPSAPWLRLWLEVTYKMYKQ